MTKNKVLGTILAATSLFGFGANTIAVAQEEPPPPAPIQPVNPDTDSVVSGCPTGSYEGAFRWNQMRQLYNCMLPFVEGFFEGVYGENWQPPAAYNYVMFDETYPHGCSVPEGQEPVSTLTDYMYCPGDNEVYLGAGSIWKYYAYMGDIAPMVGLAHELGHHLQALYIPAHQQTQLERIAAENQADCVAGAWVSYMESLGSVEADDPLNVEALLTDIAQAEDNFGREHGTLEERTESYNTGHQLGIEACNDIYRPIFGHDVEQVIRVTPDTSVDAGTAETPVIDQSLVYDCASGPISEPCLRVQVGGTELPAPANCEATTGAESCNQAFTAAFERWGANLPQLYGTARDRNLTLGYFLTASRNDTYAYALIACIQVSNHDEGPEAGQLSWFDFVREDFPDFGVEFFVPMFDSTMQLVCPDLNYTPIYDQDPPQSTTTTGPVPQTTGATVLINVSDGNGGTVQQAYTCSDIAFPLLFENAYPSDDIDANTVCTPRQEEVFRFLVETQPTGFDDYVSSGEIGVFGGSDIDAPTRAAFGWWACFGASDLSWDVMTYTTEMQRFFANSSSMDTNAAWEKAFQYVCPGMRPAV